MAGRVLGIAAGLVIVLLAALWLMIRHDEPVGTTDIPRDRAAASPPASAAPGATPSAPLTPARTGTAAAVQLVRRPPPSVDQAAPPVPVPAVADETPRKPPTFKRVLQEQVRATENLIAACNVQATKAGKRANGETAVSFTLARQQDGRIALEATGVEYSSLDDQPLVDCIRETAKEISVESLPDGADAIIAYRKVVMKEGDVVTNLMSEYSVVRTARR